MQQQTRTRSAPVAGLTTAVFILGAATFAPQPAEAQDGANFFNTGSLSHELKFGAGYVRTSADTEFFGTGTADGNANAICLNASDDYWSTAIRYAGEFSGFRVGATGSLCQGFGTASQDVGGFDGRTRLGTFVTFGARLSAPLNVNGFRFTPYVGGGGAYAHVKVEAFPFESDSSWRFGNYWEAGVAFPLMPVQKSWGAGTVQSIDAAATEMYLSYRRMDVGSKTLSGGARTDTKWDMVLIGVNVRR